MYSRRSDQTDLKLLHIYYFLLRKGVSFLQNYLLKLEITKKINRSCWLPEHRNKKAKGKDNLQKKEKKRKKNGNKRNYNSYHEPPSEEWIKRRS